MKKVLSGKELRDIMLKTVNLICDATSSTLGPSGNNVLIDNDETSPFITNDGVTIAFNISSDNKIENTILEIIKEASLKTNEKVGDGTTTTLVLLQSIFNNGIKKIESGTNPIVLKKELDNTLNIVIEKLKEFSRLPSKKDYISIASISANDKEIGKFLENIFSKMGSKYSIKLEEGNFEDTYYEIKKGYTLEIDNIPNIYFDNKKEINLNDVSVLLLNGYLNDLESISEIINEGLNRNRSIVILASDYDEEIRNQVILYNLQMNKNIYLFKIPDYGSRKDAIIKDISLLTNANIKNNGYEKVAFNDLGVSKKIIINKEELIIINDININSYIDELKNEYKNSFNDYEKEFLIKRISFLENGIATIYVGGNTRTEIKEKIMRFEDALCALEQAKEGVLIGEGIPLLQISDEIDDEVIKPSLKFPFNKIMSNSLGEYKEIEKNILNSKYKLIYNFNTCELENISDTDVLDPTNVTIESLKNAVSIASMLLTTNYVVINDSEKTIDNAL